MVVIAGPLLFGLAGLVRARREPKFVIPSWDWKLTIASALLYVLAFNLTFFVQELWLVLPKAFTPGLRPTLFADPATVPDLDRPHAVFESRHLHRVVRLRS